ncbi:MAG: hypothetical protein J6W13_08085 [Salinivirgaceae bacterium]|nr:hypothetical protein [Salinivirgaceae bacterium]
MKVAIIDLGTNTFNILIADIRKGQPTDYLLKTKSAVMLGKEGLMTGNLTDKAFARSFAVLRDYSSLIKDYGCEKVFAFGTSAIRSANNSAHLIEKVNRDLGIQITPISGEEETKYVFNAMLNAVPPQGDSNYMMVDIGGGNNEVIIGREDRMLWSASYELGSARLLELFKPSDPITPGELASINHYLDEKMADFNEAIKQYPVTRLIGSAGAFDSFAEMIHQKKTQRPLPLNSKHSNFTADDFNGIYKTITTTTRDKRSMILGLEPLRQDTIVMSSTFVKYLLEKTQITSITQSSYALTEGVAIQLENTL